MNVTFTPLTIACTIPSQDYEAIRKEAAKVGIEGQLTRELAAEFLRQNGSGNLLRSATAYKQYGHIVIEITDSIGQQYSLQVYSK